MHFFINGSFISQKENALLSVLDLGLLRGVAVFDYLRTYELKPFHLEEHIARFFYSASQIGIELSFTFQEVEHILMELIQKNSPQESSLKFIATGGVSDDQFLPSSKGSFMAFSYPLTAFPPSHFEEGIRAATLKQERSLAHVKTTHYLPAVLSLQKAKSNKIFETLYVKEDHVLEGATSNFFAIKNGKLITPSEEGILIGITREVILRIAKDILPVEIRPLSLQELFLADEAFICSSSKELMPVIEVDQKQIGTGKAGPITKQLSTLFQNYTKQTSYPPLSIPRYNLNLSLVK
jgi:branched-chain amino acid aminotransferase